MREFQCATSLGCLGDFKNWLFASLRGFRGATEFCRLRDFGFLGFGFDKFSHFESFEFWESRIRWENWVLGWLGLTNICFRWLVSGESGRERFAIYYLRWYFSGESCWAIFLVWPRIYWLTAFINDLQNEKMYKCFKWPKTEPLTSATRQVRQQWFSVGIFPLGLLFGLTGNRPQSAPACSFLRYCDTKSRLNNCFTVSYDWQIKPAVPSAVSYRGIGCMVQPLSGEAPGKQYQSSARVASDGAGNREADSLWSLNAN